MSRKKNAQFLSVAIMAMAVAASATAVTTANAQSISADQEIAVSIRAQSLSDALRQLAETTGLQLVYDTRITDGRTSPGVTGRMSARAALSSLLAGSGLNIQYSGDRTAIISSPSTVVGGADDGVREVGVVTVEGVSGNMPFGQLASPTNGINGSRDVQATEGTGSYTTGAASIGSKLPQPLRETAASVTVMTAQQIEDQALVSIRDIMEKIAGITVTTGGNTEDFDFSSRGILIEQITIDGGAPLIFEYNNRPVLDMSQFDSVQLVRGADGLFGGYGDPGGAVNLQRKKPLDHRQITYEQDIGSWSNFREELDVTGPMAFRGRLRGRLVLSQADKEQFFEVAEQHKSSVYGVLEYDVTQDMLLTLGGNYVRERNIPNSGGLPRFADGSEIDFPVSTCLCVPWAYDDADRTELFGTIDLRLNDSLSSRLNITYNDQQVDGLYINSSSTIIPGGTATGNLGGYASDNPLEQLSADFSTSGQFTLFGRRHTFVVGTSYQSVSNAGGSTTFYPQYTIPDIFNYDPNAYAELPIPSPYVRILENDAEIFGTYGNLRIELFENLHATVGLRYSSYSDSGAVQYDFDGDGVFDPVSVSPQVKERSLSDPNFGFTYDFLDNFTLYGTYQSTYRPQVATRFAQIDFVPPPVTGENEELGVKWQSPSARLNASLSVYNITQNGYLTEDFTNPGSLVPLIQDTTSRGVEVEVAGELVRGLQVSLSYAYNDNEISYDGTTTQPRSSYTPHHIAKAWVAYRGETGSRLERYVLGAGASLQSSAFNQGFLCPDPPSNDPNVFCTQPFVPFEFTTDGYATFSARLGYRLTDNIEIALNGDNIGNLKTYATNPGQGLSGYNYYIQPRSFIFSLRAKW